MIVDPDSGEPLGPASAASCGSAARRSWRVTSAATPATPDGWFDTGDLC